MSDFPSLHALAFCPYIEPSGGLNRDLQGKIGIYGIFDDDRQLQYVGYSRNVYGSLLQHLVRCPRACGFYKWWVIAKPSRQVLEQIRGQWLEENPTLPPGNGDRQGQWCDPINIQNDLTPEERAQYEASEITAQEKILKTVARRVEAQLKTQLVQRGFTEEVRFNPKLKAKGLLDLK